MKDLNKTEILDSSKNLRKCFKCKESFPATPEFFHRHKSFPLGLTYICKKCKNEYDKDQYKSQKNGTIYLDKLENFLKETSKNLENLRICSKCNQHFPATPEFFGKNKKMPLGINYWCKICKKEYDKDRHRKNRYGISKSQYTKNLMKQNDGCDICGRKTDQYIPSIDHDHKTGDNRGVLSNNCNVVLGFSNENPFILIKAIKYLKKH